MSKTFVYERYEISGAWLAGKIRICEGLESDGEWVKAEDAINRDAVLTAQIRTLETQLNEGRQRERFLMERLERATSKLACANKHISDDAWRNDTRQMGC